MRVLVVTNMYPSDRFPALGTFVRDQVDSLRRRGVDIDVLLIQGAKKDKSKYLKAVLPILRQVHAHGYDLVHAHYVFSGLLARLQMRLPILVSFHGGGEMVGWQGALCRLLAPLVDAVTVTSEVHKRELGRKDAHVIPCGVDLDSFKPAPAGSARQRLGLPPDRKLVLFVAELRPEKRLDLAQKAVALLEQWGLDVGLVTVTGKPHDVVPVYMNACDVLVLTSQYEGSPVAIKEAMACNLPIVSVDVGDVAEVIGGTDGCFICSRSPQDIAEKLETALHRPCRTAGRIAVQHLRADLLADRMLQVYTDTIRKKGSKRQPSWRASIGKKPNG